MRWTNRLSVFFSNLKDNKFDEPLDKTWNLGQPWNPEVEFVEEEERQSGANKAKMNICACV